MARPLEDQVSDDSPESSGAEGPPATEPYDGFNKAVQLHFRVTDTGIGIDEQAQARIFNAFEQADDSSSRVFGGTGLGLAITKTIAELMEGDVYVDSRPGMGSVFVRPAADAPIRADPGSTSARCSGPGMSRHRWPATAAAAAASESWC